MPRKTYMFYNMVEVKVAKRDVPTKILHGIPINDKFLKYLPKFTFLV
jgi:hypothetical protein